MTITEPCLNREFRAGRNWRTTILWEFSYFFMVLRYGRSCEEMCGAILWVGETRRLINSTKYLHHAPMTTTLKKKNWKSVGKLSKICSQIVLKFLYLARIGRPDILWSVNKLARSITKWTKAFDKRLIRLISYIHHTCAYKQYCYVGNTAKQCRLGLFSRLRFCRRSWGLKIHFLEEHCVFLEVIHLFQQVGCVRNKLQFHTVQQNPKSSLWTLDWDWMVFPHLICGIWLFLF